VVFLSIDLQHGFKAADNPRIIKAAQEEVRRAIRFNYGIIFLQYWGFGPTFPEIKHIARNYDNKITVQKNDDDGGANVLDAAFEKGFNLNKFRVCGVNTDMCVYDTIYSLTHLSPASKILVRKDGCGSCCKNDFGKFKELRNVKIINGK
jgi:nicotinamidase-related amidase